MEVVKNDPLRALKRLRLGRLSVHLLTFLITIMFAFIQHLVWNYSSPAPYVLFYPAIILACMYGDGTLAIILSALLAQIYFVPPFGEFKFNFGTDAIRTFLFILTGFMIRTIIKSETKARLEAEDSAELIKREQEARDRFVSMLHHDLQNPLTTIKLTSDFIFRNATNPGIVVKNIHKQSSSIKRMEDMIHDLLDANKIQANSPLSIQLEFCDLKDIITQTVNDLESIYGKRFIIEGAATIRGNWGKDSIRRIVENLCNNAIKYGDAERPILISYTQKNNLIFISVNNKGPPIPPDDLKILFDPYKRSQNALDKKGWGLGLTLVKGLVEAHGGEIQVTSNETEGTTFSFYLPLKASIPS